MKKNVCRKYELIFNPFRGLCKVATSSNVSETTDFLLQRFSENPAVPNPDLLQLNLKPKHPLASQKSKPHST